MTTITKDAQIDIHLGEPGRAQLLVDGVDLSNLVYRTEFVMEANHVGRLVLHCHARNLRIHGVGDAVVGKPIGTMPPLRSARDNDLPAPACEVCGQPSTAIVVDALDVTPVDAVACEYCPLLPAHYFCPAHVRDSITFKVDRQPAAA